MNRKRNISNHEKGWRRVAGPFVAAALLSVTGCVTVPKVELSPSIGAEELSQHVHFLAQPALKGRRPRTRGSRLARRYIVDRFERYGLVPWGEAEAFTQSFVIGTNVIGVLPGSDRNLADEVVILSAHYDHLGKTEEGLCLGAADNAAGVAALLEIAEHLALNQPHPRRSICFAAFDCEEDSLLGACAFTRRADYDPNRIAGVVNIDMLGRTGFGVLDRHLFVVGGAGYPTVRDRLKEAAPDLHLLPMGGDFVGIRSDHAAFCDVNACILFFTCGLYEDYHLPGDRAEKVDYDEMCMASDAVQAATTLLADTPQRLSRQYGPAETAVELEALKYCLDRIIADPNALGWSTEQPVPLEALAEELETYLNRGMLTDQGKRDLLFKHFDALTLLAMWPQDPCDLADDPRVALQQHWLAWRLGLVSLDFSDELVATGWALIDHLSRYRHRLRIGMPEFDGKWGVLHDDYVHLEAITENDYRLTAIPLIWSLKVKPPGLLKWPLRTQPQIRYGARWLLWGSRGTREELLDACLLGWEKSLREGEPNRYWNKMVALIAEIPEEHSYEHWLNWHLESQAWANRDEWLKACLLSSNAFLARNAILSLPERPDPILEPTLIRIILNSHAHPHIRTDAIGKLHNRSKAETLQALVDTIDDPTMREVLSLKIGPDHPLKNLGDFIQSNRSKEYRLWTKTRQATSSEDPSEKTPIRTVGGFALKRLKEVTGKDFGEDKQAWTQWLASRK